MFYIDPLEDTPVLEKIFKQFELLRFSHPIYIYNQLAFGDTISSKLKKEINSVLDRLKKADLKDFPDVSEFDTIVENLTLDDIINFAFEECKRYIPDRLKSYYLRINRYKKFEQGIKNHIFFSVAMRHTFENSKKDKDTHYKSFNEFIRDLAIITNNSPSELTDKKYDMYRERLSAFAKFEGYMDNFVNEYRKRPLKYQQHYIYYSLIEYDIIPQANKPRNVVFNHYQDFVNRFIEHIKHYEISYPNISNYIIERTYNPALTNAIVSYYDKIDKANYESLRRALCLLVLLPDVENRAKYVKAFLHRETYEQSENEFGWGIGSVYIEPQPINIKDWIDNISRDIIQYGLIFMPLLEKYTLYLIKCLFEDKEDAENSFIYRSIAAKDSIFPALYSRAEEVYGDDKREDYQKIYEDAAFYMLQLNNLELYLMKSFSEVPENTGRNKYRESIITDALKAINAMK